MVFLNRVMAKLKLMVSIEMGIGALGALSVGILHDGTSRPFAITIVCLFFLAVLLYIIGPEDTEIISDTEI